MLLYRFFLLSYLVLNTSPLKDAAHVVLVAPPFFGHIIPLLDLAQCLSKYHHVSFVLSSSKFNDIQRRKLLPRNENIQFIELFDQNVEELEIGSSIGSSFIELVLDRMNKPLEEVFSSATTAAISYPIDLMIYDPIVYIAAHIAQQKRIPIHAFVPNSLMFIKRYIDISMGNIDHSLINRNFASEIVKSLPLIDGLICNSIEQFDRKILDELYQQALLRRDLPVRFIAPLITQTNEHQDTDAIAHIKIWLNKQQTNSSSIIYVAFGSLARLEPEQLVEIAHALQNYSVIWSLKTHFQIHLPSSFTNDSRHLLLNWTPQRFILSQSAVRLFISHGGWNSLLESMLAGKITLVWPVFADQFINGYRLENELQTGRCLRNLKNQSDQQIITRNVLGQYLEEIFAREKFYSNRTRRIQQIIEDAQQNSSRQAFEDILQIIRHQRLTRYDEL